MSFMDLVSFVKSEVEESPNAGDLFGQGYLTAISDVNALIPVGEDEESFVEKYTLWWDDTHWFPFNESENGAITGPGHQEVRTFAKLVTQYDFLSGLQYETSADEVKHVWIREEEDGTLSRFNEPVIGGHPATIIWYTR